MRCTTEPNRQLEIEMETGLTPREIQAKIRAGTSVQDVAGATDIAQPTVEALAAPVLAERDHIAIQARNASLRRHGTSVGHQALADALAERLRERGADPESMSWDSFKMADGRWSVSADYSLQQAHRQAVFYYDTGGRFAVAGNDEARWVTGEHMDGETPAEDAKDASDEPTVRLVRSEDELALIRAVETDEDTDGHPTAEPDRVADQASAAPQSGSPSSGTTEPATGPESADEPAGAQEPAGPENADEIASSQESTAEEAGSEPVGEQSPQDPTQLELLYDMLGDSDATDSAGATANGPASAGGVPDSAVISDAAAVPVAPVDPELTDPAGEQPTDYPAEPEPEADQPDLLTAAAESEPEQAATAHPHVDGAADGTDTAAATRAAQPDAAAASEQSGNESASEPAGQTTSTAKSPSAKSKKRKRASVPSWDEIMFGAPPKDR